MKAIGCLALLVVITSGWDSDTPLFASSSASATTQPSVSWGRGPQVDEQIPALDAYDLGGTLQEVRLPIPMALLLKASLTSPEFSANYAAAAAGRIRRQTDYFPSSTIVSCSSPSNP
jgi:hypothetical protein